MYSEKKNYRKVGLIFKIDHSTVRYIVKNDYTRVKKKRGPKKKISPREKTKIKVEVKRLQSKNERVFARKIKTSCNIDTSLRTLQRAMSELGLEYKKIQQKLPLTNKHKKQRVEFARKWIAENTINKNVVFSDEKRFSFDGPDNWSSWYDPLDPPLRIKRQMKGGGIMVWGMILPTGEIFVEKLVGRVNADVYIQMLKEKVVPHLNLKLGREKFIFQQDNCRVHTAEKTKNYLKSAKIAFVEWPSMSPDLNVMENVWKMISDIVYNQKQYDSADFLWESVKKAVADLNITKKDILKKFFDNYGNRLLKVIDCNGKDIPY